jgi:hypothetical protein
MLRILIRSPLLLMAMIVLFWSSTSQVYAHGYYPGYYPGYRGDYNQRGGVVRGAARGAVVGAIVGGGDPRAVRNGAAIGSIAGGVKRARYNNQYYGGYPRPYYR